jgi:RNA polymerase sigma-70 factor (ECF subfamily)
MDDTNELTVELLRSMSGLRAQLTRIIRDADLAADLLQDAVVTALQKLRAGEIKAGPQMAGYVYGIALNHFRNYRRKDKSARSGSEPLGEIPDPAGPARVIESLESAQWARLVTQLLQEVTPVRDRELLIRFYLKEEPKEELCHALGLTELHFNRVICRARDRFRTLLSQRGFGKADFLTIGIILLTAI